MTGPAPDPGVQRLQFDHADTTGSTSSGPTCAICRRPITTYYYETAGTTVCSSCRNRVLAQTVSGAAASSFLRATLFGFVGALVGAAIYYAVLVATGYEIGLIAIVVGFIVGYAVRKGAGGRGGRRYQILALVLTYLAIGGTYVPLAMREVGRRPRASADSLAAKQRAAADTALAGDTGIAVATAESPRAPAATARAASPSFLRLALALGALVLLAAAMPLLAVIFGFPQSIISALIIGFALSQAWRMNRGLKTVFTGPFKVAARAPGPAAGD
jgi:hypothetical protein